MAEKEPTQFTPKSKAERKAFDLPERSEGGNEIPIPTRQQVNDDFARIVQPIPAKPEKRRGRHTK